MFYINTKMRSSTRRYLYEAKKSIMFDQSAFEATLEMVLREFRKRYRIQKVKPL